MNKRKIPIIFKLFLLAGTLELLAFIIILFSFYSYSTLSDSDELRNLQSIVLQAYQQRSEFSKKRQMEFVDGFEKKINEFQNNLMPFEDERSATNILLLKKRYLRTFNEYKSLMIKRGLNENKGIEGKFRESVHNIEDIIKNTNNNSIYVLMLQIRRREKDYILRKDMKYSELVKSLVDSMTFKINELNITNDKKQKMIQLSRIYYDNFHQLVNVFHELQKIENNLIMIENQLQQKLEDFVNDKSSFANTIQNLQIIIIILSLLIGIILSIVLAKKIAKPIEILQFAAHRIAGGKFDTKAEVNSNDELGELADSFNTMVDNINSSRATILEQQEKLKDSNRELEGLTKDLRNSLQNISVLSNIGKSLTSHLKYENIFIKLYSDLSKLIQSSAFGIGIINKNNHSLDYKLLMKEGKQIESTQISFENDSRLDILCLKSNQEIMIKNLDDDMKTLMEYYDWVDGVNKFEGLQEESNSLIYIPIKIKEETIGILSIENKIKNSYNAHDLDTLRNLASYVAIAIMNAQAYDNINKAHEKLKRTQDQLVQAEKMASLGQLTTGIAHEIKNPLNFIKNYSEGTQELCEELIEDFENQKDLIDEEDYEDIIDLINDINGYLETIARNGKRIDNIVKSMMEHARGSTGIKMPTNVNNFLKEYSYLAYKGFRTQYSNFNTNIKFELEDNLPEVMMKQQDFSRVLTNIVDNACYSMYKKQKENENNSFQPEFIIKTTQIDNKIQMVLRDNGVGIPESVIKKVFNPFFTTKPTGEGTGLGLSLSYDIVTAGHSGTMQVNSIVGEYAEFVITLPVEKEL